MKRLLASCFGLGWLPVAPGTWGSIPPAVIFLLLNGVFWTPPPTRFLLMAILALTGSVVCIKYAAASIEATGETDPAEVVADEFAGQSVTFLFISLLSSFWEILSPTIVGFLLFRFFDIVKPWPIRKLEKLSSGWGILVDDLLAGIYAGIGLLIYSLYLYPHLPWSQEFH